VALNAIIALIPDQHALGVCGVSGDRKFRCARTVAGGAITWERIARRSTVFLWEKVEDLNFMDKTQDKSLPDLESHIVSDLWREHRTNIANPMQLQNGNNGAQVTSLLPFS
jgi:hypothetical protein